VFLVGCLILVDLAALVNGLVVSRTLGSVLERSRPLASATHSVRQEILAAQTELFRYLAEFEDDTAAAAAHVDALARLITDARQLAMPPEAEIELEEIEKGAERMRKLLDIMPAMGEGPRDWSRLQEFRTAAGEESRTIEEHSLRLTEIAETEIRNRYQRLAQITTLSVRVFAGVLASILVVVLFLRRWWRRFQDYVLGL
jgi:hypothetical protein